MRVGVYVPDFGGPEAGGAHTFARDVLVALSAAPGTHEFQVLHAGELPLADSVGLPFVRLPEPGSLLEPALESTARRLGIELIWFLVPESQPVTLPYIATVWDLEHRNQPFFPEVSITGWTWEQRELYYRTTLPRAACVIVGTPEGKRQVERYYAVPAARIAIVPLPTPSFAPEDLREDAESFARLGVRSPYLYYPAQFWPHKNHVALLHALKILVDEGDPHDLVLTGADKGNLAYVRALTAELGLAEHVKFLGFVERLAVVALYRRAQALVFPSYFGPDNLPPLEAFALGCPVVAAAVPGAEERLGDAALLFDPRDPRALATAVRKLQFEPGLREKLVRRGAERARACTPADYVRAVVARCDDLASVRGCWSSTEPYVHP
jgi:glycosyltransferase involved in cell wall biosynthesis